MSKHRVVIVGGGAGGLELATRLGDTLGQTRPGGDITLIDKHRTHVWKPKLHEIAAGSMDMSAHEVDYLAQAHWHRFRFRSWRAGRHRPRSARGTCRPLPWTTKACWSRTRAHSPTTRWWSPSAASATTSARPACASMRCGSSREADAQRFHQRMLNACIRAHAQTSPLRPEQLHVAIIGAGATGVELAAELHLAPRARWSPTAWTGWTPIDET